jgi:hypothetical protein
MDQIVVMYVAGAVASLVLVVIIFLLWRLSKRPKITMDAEEIETIRAEDIRAEGRKTRTVPRRRHTLDSTKRKSLQPGNSKIVPCGWETIESKQPNVVVDIIPTLRGAVQYKFYGSALCMKDKVLVSGLSKKMHKLEITDKDEMYIDNEIYTKIHIDDIRTLKRFIFEVQGKA